jgi:glycosyltransferase involved in cell wall biosynthesis
VILFLISSYRINNSGSGGHYFTCETIYREYRKSDPAIIVNVGDFISPSLEKKIPELIKIKVSRFGIKSPVGEISNLVLEHGVTLIHAFDSFSYNLARLVEIKTGVPSLSTKCGGPNARYWPGWVPHTVLSRENHDFYSEIARRKGLDQPLLAPGRASLGAGRQSEGHELKSISPVKGKINVLRIGRLHASYLDSHLQSINLVEALNGLGVPAHLHIVGFINEKYVYDELKDVKPEFVSIYVDASYTTSASRHLELADVVVASGRGVMEAAALGKVVMCSASGNKFPILLDQGSFDGFFRLNFSPRIESSIDDSIEGRVFIISEIMKNPDMHAQYKIFIKEMFYKYFDVRKSVEKYRNIYSLRVEKGKQARWNVEVIFSVFFDIMKKFIRQVGGTK